MPGRTVLRSIVLVAALACGGTALAGEFSFMAAMDTDARGDLAGFKARLGAHFAVGPAQIDLVFSNMERPSDVYMCFQLAKLTGRPVDVVITEHRAHKGQGWGAIAKSMGIKPGSREFHALKKGGLPAAKGRGGGKHGGGAALPLALGGGGGGKGGHGHGKGGGKGGGKGKKK